ncbi:PepSY domain-containing protein [Clostridium tertium]|uniref:PepSY domain-containing protein n=1 Tax=Clostridium tertium TaxID=1559 RepID=UPI00232B8EDC|nr:PepSY domain-containing protein [Clostridium tertium]MDB1956450.1 PepSY domain-containing protein [Clostridium tertium]MDB1958662.1 PepSY domain-containing protein [Clostridium tertium]MDB1964022.1 PepSY domain-containing protein [Clostridium tertium]MDB1967480.1 PepSY domain-containing protein [Clostridium tertium]
MKKLLPIIMISIAMSISGCNNKDINDNINKSDTIKVTLEQAKEIALKHANLINDQVSFIRAETDLDNGIEKYDIEFYHENIEYDYEINVANGEIIEYDHDVENYNINNKQTPIRNIGGATEEQGKIISVDQAKEIALKHANLTSDQVTFGKSELDFDDGIQKYYIEFYYNNREHSFEIDANTGKVLANEKD